MSRHIALVGLSGTGKSTVARLLAERLALAWVDTDGLIVARIGQPIAAFFQQQGEAAFRDVEAEILRDVLDAPQPTVIATGGGMVLREENRARLQAGASVIWLDAPTAELLARLLAHDEARPLLAGSDPAARIEGLRAAREPLYRNLADVTVQTAGLTAAAVVEQIVAAITPTPALGSSPER
ncbi:MAG: shikimate kinase [Chloroflexaceae bacterium]|nr:shikimate kinase [Chloroflexaceae bacterium]